MTVRILWSRLARDALLDIYLIIGLHSPVAAECIYDRIEHRAEKLREHPRMGPRRPDIRPGARVLVEPPYIVRYEITPDTAAPSNESVRRRWPSPNGRRR
ncbi:type II toxin-antitoxin system RelE/ParE family toxin [Methylobacterium currus]|uniref:type II toxin-antitoxin system RelE/ParE family toxin n=1 Tax=Methylobacterium currus TaxID=2051553 RepID=UPI001E28B938|nr:type II toxin-antitoxin system RelE/ParE family toxin [Methylobacterium currus]UHC15168.1 type II toxin-antitoxin system RelE/ParE family toxin [Methylobacterium currus]